MKQYSVAIILLFAAFFSSCSTQTYRSTPAPIPKSPDPTVQGGPTSPVQPGKEQTTQPKNGTDKPVDGNRKQVYRLAVVLPFLTDQFDSELGAVPEKSSFATQFYGGMQLAFESMSILMADYPQLVVDVIDTKSSDLLFDQVLSNPRLSQAEVVIGPNRNAQLTKLAEVAKAKRQILISPQSPSSGLTENYPGFIQLNPSLKTHCARIIQYLRGEKYYGADQVVLVGKEKEADRFAYFQDVNKAFSAQRLQEIILPDNSLNFDKIDFSKYCRPGKPTVFVMPSWAGQDWVVSFLSRLKRTKGSNKVEVFGMPQWLDYVQIEAELLKELNVHVSSASFIDYKDEQVKIFERSFFDRFGTIPGEDAFNGWDTAFFAAAMLQQYGLSFPEKATANQQLFDTFRGGIYLRRIQTKSAPVDSEAPVLFDYAENIRVHILRFDQYDFIKI